MRGRKYQKANAYIDKNKTYSPQEAISLAKKASFANFDETMELHLKMGANPQHSEQQVRGVAILPNGLGKKVRILVFSAGEGQRIAKEAGADYVGGEELVKQVEGGFLDFDVALATPDIMGRVGRLGKILGPRGLMPNPKAGTIVQPQDLPRVIREAKQGRVEFKLDKTGALHIPFGKRSFEDGKLLENLASAIEAVMKAKPSGIKGQYIKSAHICTTMGPGIKLDIKPLLSLKTA